MLTCIRLNLGAGDIEQRPDQAQATEPTLTRHRGGTGDASPTQQIVEQCFGLIAPMLGEQQATGSTVGKGGITRPTGCRLEALSGPQADRDPAHVQRNTQIPTIAGTEISPGVGVGRQAMMDMNGGETTGKREPAQNMGQNDRIAAAGKSDAKALMQRQAGGQESADPLAEIS